MNLWEQKSEAAVFVQKLQQLCQTRWWIYTVKGLLLTRVPSLYYSGIWGGVLYRQMGESILLTDRGKYFTDRLRGLIVLT